MNGVLRSNPPLTIEWLAGFFDGEGCLSLSADSARNGHITPILSFTNTSKETLEAIQQSFGGRLYTKGVTRTDWTPSWVLLFSGRELVNAIAERLLPHVITKKPEIEFYLQGQEVLTGGKRGRGVFMPPEIIEKRLEFKRGLSAFKSRTKLKLKELQ